MRSVSDRYTILLHGNSAVWQWHYDSFTNASWRCLASLSDIAFHTTVNPAAIASMFSSTLALSLSFGTIQTRQTAYLGT